MSAIITNAGKTIIANRIKGLGTEPIYFGWGTGTTEPTVLDTDLETPAAEARVAGTSAIVTVNVTEDTFQVSGSITSLSDQEITEWALFDALVNGNMICREVQNPGKSMVTGGILNFTIKFPVNGCS